MITGANSGIGKCVATGVAQRGGTVHMVCRNSQLAEAAKQHITDVTNNTNIYIHTVDLSNPKGVYQFAKQFAKNNEKLDALVNNAGCMTPTAVIDGFDVNFATNTLAPHLLTRVLQPLLHRSDAGRAIMVSSGGMLKQKLDLDDIQSLKNVPFNATFAYAQQKRQQVIMTEEYARLDRKIWYAAMHPGWADTPAVRTAMPEFYAKMKDRLRTAEEGADTVLWLAVSKPAVQHSSGAFFQDRVPVPTHLPLAWTDSSQQSKTTLLTILDDYLLKVSGTNKF